MAGGSLYRPAWGAGVLEPACDLYRLPLLPYERELIATIGCSEEEYRAFTAEVIRRGKTRPAAYDGIPDVQCDPLTLAIISLVVGVVSSAVSLLMQPKVPKQQEEQQKALANRVGRTKFNTTFGFDGAQELAEYGSRIAVLFGRYQRSGGMTTGGLSVAPQLVWARMFSYGVGQGFKGLYAVGESLADSRPSIRSVVLGTGALDALPAERYAFYWRPLGGRLQGSDLLAGTRGQPASGDPQDFDDIALVPTIAGNAEPGFSMVTQPSNQKEFGTYQAIKNGTGYRLNWRVVSVPGGLGREAVNRLSDERIKIAGNQADNEGGNMFGEGRGYSCCMGLVAHNGNGYSLPATVQIRVGDEVQFMISGRKFPKYAVGQFGEQSGVNADDINNATDGERQEADDALQLGELFMINACMFQVVRRDGGRGGVYELEGPDVFIYLRCIEIVNDAYPSIGIAGYGAVRDLMITHEGGDGLYYLSPSWLGPTFYSLVKASFALVRNVRKCETTEIGIRSQVWNQGNGLCNFSEVPSPPRLRQYDAQKVSLTGGTLNDYFRRTSVFTIYLRPAGLDANGNPFVWRPLGEQFCVSGSTPQDQYNYIRLKTLDAPGQFEFRFVPRTGTDVVRNLAPSALLWRLNAQGNEVLGQDCQTAYGRFRLTITGDRPTAQSLAICPEFVQDQRQFERFSGYLESSHYKESTKSCDRGPEHSIAYVNEMVSNDLVPQYNSLAMVALSMRSGRDFQRLDAMRMWLPNGVSCKRWLDGSFGPSNLFSDLTYFQLADERAGSGALAKGELMKEEDFAKTARFLTANNIFFDGALSEGRNLRDYLTTTAPLNLCDFVVANGQFSLVPALPVDNSGAINPANVPISMMFSEGNILEDSLEVTFLESEERRDFRAIVTWREMEKDKLPATKSILMAWDKTRQVNSPQETIDMSAFCTSRHHATMVGRYLLSLRRRVDHMITFKTTPFGINLAPGNFIRMVTSSSPYSSTRNGVVNQETGAVLSVIPLADGDHQVMAYKQGGEAVEEVTLSITNGIVSDPELRGAVFSALVPTKGDTVYRVESLELDQEGMVAVTASHYPTENGRSVIADDVLNESQFFYSE